MSKPTRAVVFTDWDGTVTLEDSNDYMTDVYGFGPDERAKIMQGMLDEKVCFRDGFTKMLESISANGHSFESCIDLLLKRIKLDPGFRGFYEWCQANGVPLYVISSGLSPIIKALITKLVGEDAGEYIKILSNDVVIDPEDHTKWHITYRDETPFGHDKSRSINSVLAKYPGKPIRFYCGDGVSDLSASKTCDVLFARKGLALQVYCDRHSIPYRTFESFNDIKNEVSAEIRGKDLK